MNLGFLRRGLKQGHNPVRGGVHPDSHKEQAGNLSIDWNLPLPKELRLPLSPNGGAAAVPSVCVGETVLKGHLIAFAAERGAVNIHAPTSGIITAIDNAPLPHPSGFEAKTITLTPDGLDQWAPRPPYIDPFSLPPDELANRVEEAGVVGMGGAIFPTAVKLRQGRRFEIKTLIVNGSECEPYLTTDDLLMQECASQIIEGARLARYIIEAYRVVIAIEDNKPAAIAAIREAAKDVGAIEVVTVPARYPMGSAKQLIQAVTGLEVPANSRSNDIGVLVHNVATIYAIQQALVERKPLISRITTVAGGCVQHPRNVEALIGTPISHLFECCGGFTKSPSSILMGGPMMGQVMPNLDVPLVKGGSGVLALTAKEVNSQLPSPCIHCTRCVSACPMGLLPLDMATSSRADDLEKAQEFGLKDCILCGSCAYVCPSHIPLVQYFEYAKGRLFQRSSSEQKRDLTQKLMAARQQRVEAEAAAKKAAKAAKKAKKKPVKNVVAEENDA